MLVPYIVKKPKFEGFDYIEIGIRDKFLYSCINNKDTIEVVWGKKRAYVDPKRWVDTGQKIEVPMKYKDNPMKLYTNKVYFIKPETEEEYYKNVSLSTM
jgi:hypothetical protein